MVNVTSPRLQYRGCVMRFGVSACSNLFINDASCIHPYFVSLSFYTIPICLYFLNLQDFKFSQEAKNVFINRDCSYLKTKTKAE